MSEIFANVSERIRGFWGNINMTQRMFVGALAAVIIAVFLLLMIWINRTDFGTLYANLTPEDAARVVRVLEAQKIPFRLEQNGAAIMVPQDRVHALRISMAGDKVLTGQGVGFEIFDENQMGRTDFVQKLTYRRALEGELARTISEFPGVEGARVHLVIPNRSLLLKNSKGPRPRCCSSFPARKGLSPETWRR